MRTLVTADGARDLEGRGEKGSCGAWERGRVWGTGEERENGQQAMSGLRLCPSLAECPSELRRWEWSGESPRELGLVRSRSGT